MHVALREHGVRLQGGMDRCLVAVPVDQRLRGAVDVAAGTALNVLTISYTRYKPSLQVQSNLTKINIPPRP